MKIMMSMDPSGRGRMLFRRRLSLGKGSYDHCLRHTTRLKKHLGVTCTAHLRRLEQSIVDPQVFCLIYLFPTGLGIGTSLLMLQKYETASKEYASVIATAKPVIIALNARKMKILMSSMH